jgi:hypothetical protein
MLELEIDAILFGISALIIIVFVIYRTYFYKRDCSGEHQIG